MNVKRMMILAAAFTGLSLGFVSCLDDDDCNSNLIQIVDEPSIVRTGINDTILLDTQYGPESGQIRAPQLNGKVKSGDYLLTWFYMDLNISPYTALGLSYKKIEADTVKVIQGEIKDDYSEPVADLRIYLLNNSLDQFICVDSTFFVVIEPDRYDSQNYEYELIANKDSIDNTGVMSLYLRAKKVDGKPEYVYNNGKKYIPYALNISPLLLQSPDPSKKTVTFNLKYKSGNDSNGKDIYENYRNNPVRLTHAQ